MPNGSSHNARVEAARRQIAARMGLRSVPEGCETCALRKAGWRCDGNAAALLPCELDDGAAHVSVRETRQTPWLSETHAPLRPYYDPLYDDPWVNRRDDGLAADRQIERIR